MCMQGSHGRGAPQQLDAARASRVASQPIYAVSWAAIACSWQLYVTAVQHCRVPHQWDSNSTTFSLALRTSQTADCASARRLLLCAALQALYNFIGVVEVLQPTTDCDFVLPDEGHDMLPPGAALYKLTEPQQQAAIAAAAAGPAAACSSSSPSRKGSFNSLSSLTNISSRSLSSALAELTSSFSLGGSRNSSSNGGAGGDHDDNGFGLGMVAVPVGDSASTAAAGAAELDSPCSMALAEHPQSPAAAVAAAAAPAAAAAKASSARVVRKSPEGLTLGDAILTFMNSPHPLQTLGEMRAYGHNGSISRYHNPASYTKALQKLSKD